MLWLLLLLLPWGQQADAQWQECSSQGAFIGMYGSQALANLTTFRSNLLSHVWQSYNPEGAHNNSSSTSSGETHAMMEHGFTLICTQQHLQQFICIRSLPSCSLLTL
jgi:hypothetical protein